MAIPQPGITVSLVRLTIRRPFILAGCLTLSAVGGQAQAPPCALRDQAGVVALCDWPLRLRPGPGYVMSRRPNTPHDFDVFEVRPRADTSRVVLALYVGYHPQALSGSSRPVRVAGFRGREVRTTDAEGRLGREVHIRLPTRHKGLMVHAWYRGLPRAEAAEADGVLNSLRTH
jgi:hypothetical protein